ncbi:GerAB/ArcD/ProY family transporter [Alkaliphilus transvaalensis]|uniref:GerAB/ArcD/ProY family transporter n=1 Tax=Alkaliphilus transvaalensis TaxID=114628 RepID=UPI000478EE86|nr:endospore germination permease [Alkaliphilus transvaalensis]
MYQKYTGGEISAIQAYIIIVSIMIGTGILNLARVVSEVSKQDAWISVLINGIFISLIIGLITYTVGRFPELNFLQYCSYLLSKPIGYLISFAYIIYSIAFTATIISFLTEMASTWLLPNTPIFIISFIIVITGVYMIQHGLTVLARYNEVIVFLLIPLALLIFVGMPEVRLINLRPVGATGITAILKGVVPSFYAFAGYEVIMIYYPYISNKSKHITKYSVLSILLVTIFYTATVISQIALYGHEEIQHVLYPSINYLRAVDFPFIERMELFFTIFWTLTVLGTVGLQYFATSIVLQSVFKNKTTRFFTYLLAPLVFGLSLYPQNTPQVADIGSIIGNLNFFFGILLPIILFIMCIIREGRRKNEQKI